MEANKQKITKILTGENWKDILQGISIKKSLEILLLAADIYTDLKKNQIFRKLERLWNDYTGVTFILDYDLSSSIDSLFIERENFEPIEDTQIIELLVFHSPLLNLDEFERRVNEIRKLCIRSASEIDLNNISGIIGQKIKNYLFNDILIVEENWSNGLKRTLLLNLLNIMVGNDTKFPLLNSINAISLYNLLNTLSDKRKSEFEKRLKTIKTSLNSLNEKQDPISLGINNSLMMILHTISDSTKWDNLMLELTTSLDLDSLVKDKTPVLDELTLLEIFENLRIPKAIKGNIENVERFFDFFKNYEEQLSSGNDKPETSFTDMIKNTLSFGKQQFNTTEQYWLDYTKLFDKIINTYNQWLDFLWNDLFDKHLNFDSSVKKEYHKALSHTSKKAPEWLSKKLVSFLESWLNFTESKTVGEKQHKLVDFKGEYLSEELLQQFRKDPHQFFWTFVVEFRKLLSFLVFRILYDAAKIISEEITFHLFYPLSTGLFRTPLTRAKFALSEKESGKKKTDRKEYSFSSQDNKNLVEKLLSKLENSNLTDELVRDFSESFERLYQMSSDIYSPQSKHSTEDFETLKNQENLRYMLNFIRNYYKIVNDTG